MSDSEPPRRIYGEKEIGRILKRATELQHAEPTPTAAGMTLAELEEIGAEAGIDGRHLRRAAFELEAGIAEPGPWAKLLGGELRIVREVTVPGELAERGFERVVGVIQTTAEMHGQPSLLGRTLTWRAESPSKARTTQVVVSVRGGKTHVRIEENLGQLAGGLFGGTMGGGGGGLGFGLGLPAGLALGSPLLAFVFPVGVVGVAYMLSRGIYRTIVSRRREAVELLVGRVLEEIRESIASEPGGRLESLERGS